MTLFGIVAAVFVLVALAFLLRPLVRASSRGSATTQAANLAIYRDQFAELERDLKLGTLDNAQYEAARAELQKRMLQEAGEGTGRPVEVGRASKAAALLIALAVPAVAAVLYGLLGQPEGIGVARQSLPDSSPVSPEDFQAMTDQLAERMRQNPNDAVGWVMLGRAYKALERYPDAVMALEKAYALQPAEAEVMVEYAEALAQASGSLQGRPRELLSKALAITPNDAKALTMAGGAAFEAQEYARAIAYWEKLSIQVPEDSELAKALASGIERARALQADEQAPKRTAASGDGAIRGRVDIAATLRDNAAPNDTVFIFARATQGPRMPIAIVRKQVKDLPTEFILDDASSMGGQTKLSTAGEVIVTARVSRSGSATPAAGDLQGESQALMPGAEEVSITIDEVVQ